MQTITNSKSDKALQSLAVKLNGTQP